MGISFSAIVSVGSYALFTGAALRRIWRHPGVNQRFWQAGWTFAAVAFPVIGSLFFFAFAEMPPVQDAGMRVRGRNSDRFRYATFGDAHLEGIPYLYALVTGERQLETPDGGSADAAQELGALAGQGDAEAQYCLALLYDTGKGKGFTQDYAAAIAWYLKAAEKGHAAAQTRLGQMYAEGLGLPVNEELAAAWYRKAAERGHAPAQAELGAACFKGAGVDKSAEEAYFWLRCAEMAGWQGHAAIRAELEKTLGPERLAALQQRALDWEPPED